MDHGLKNFNISFEALISESLKISLFVGEKRTYMVYEAQKHLGNNVDLLLLINNHIFDMDVKLRHEVPSIQPSSYNRHASGQSSYKMELSIENFLKCPNVLAKMYKHQLIN